MSSIKKIIAPKNSIREKISSRTLGRVLHQYRTAKDKSYRYEKWISEVEPTLWLPTIDIKSSSPLISIITPAFNTPAKYLGPLIDSVISQTYVKWELILVDGGSSAECSKMIAEYTKRDKRIKLVRSETNLGISGNTNLGINEASGEYIAFLDHDDTLSTFALNEVVSMIQKSLNVDIIYSDEDKLLDSGTHRILPYFKPDWSPELIQCVNYVTHFFVVKRLLANKIGGIRKAYDGAQDYDFVLRLLDHNPVIKHIPKVLYHWRLADGSTAISVDKKSTASDAGQRAMKDYIKRNKIKATVRPMDDTPSNHHVSYSHSGDTLVSIIIPFKDKVSLTKACVNSILERTKGVSFEILLISNGSVEKSTQKYLSEIRSNPKVRIFEYPNDFNWSAINNYGASKAKGNIFAFLNNDTKVINGEWLKELAGVAEQKNVGAVGPLLYYPDNKIQHAGVVLGMTGMAGHVFRNAKLSEYTIFGFPYWSRNCVAVTGACLVVSKKKYHKIGGFNEEFVICGSDITFCIDLFKSGYRNVYWPFAQLTHYESKSVGSYNNIPKSDYDLSLTSYEPYLSKGDPYYNPNLSLLTEKVELGRPE